MDHDVDWTEANKKNENGVVYSHRTHVGIIF